MRLRDLNPFWRQLPVYSPVTFGSLWAGLAGASGRGEPIQQLRDLLTREYRFEDLLLVDSGTSALRLAIEGGLAETGSDIVALPAYCCFDVATAAVGADAKVALYDVRPETLGPDFESLRAALDAGARAVVVAHLYGIPVDLDRSRDLATEYDAILIEDAAQGAGGSWRDRPLGSWGDVGILSFGRGKGRTGGGGGALLANNEAGASIVEGLRDRPGPGGGGIGSVLKLAAQWALGRPALYGIPASLPFLGLGETKYKEPWEPRGMATGPAAALLANWEASKREEETRRSNGIRTIVRKAVCSQYRLLGANATQPNGGWLRLAVAQRPELPEIENLIQGAAPGYPKILEEIGVLQNIPGVECSLENAKVLTRDLVTLPTHRWIDLDMDDG